MTAVMIPVTPMASELIAPWISPSPWRVRCLRRARTFRWRALRDFVLDAENAAHERGDVAPLFP